jgi:uncharacterized protein (DUF169 family)
MPTYPEIAASLTASLNLTQPPIAISLTNVAPAGVSLWGGSSPAGCRFWQEAAARTFATQAADHNLCAIGLYTHNLEISPAAMTDLGDALKVFAGLTYVREEDVAAIPVLKDKPKYVVYGPLGETPGAPDVVLLFVRADQTLILSEASHQVEGNMPPAMGRPACALIPQVHNSGRSALSLGCCGARAYLDVLTPEVALYAIPGASAGAFAERIEALSKANGVLAKFHGMRRAEVEAGKLPTIQESLAALQAAG